MSFALNYKQASEGEIKPDRYALQDPSDLNDSLWFKVIYALFVVLLVPLYWIE